MAIHPPSWDVWLAQYLAGFLERYPLFDQCVQSGIRHHALGGFLYGVALYLVWIEATRSGNRETRLRVLTILVGSSLAIAMTTFAGYLVAWPPPIRHPDLAHLFPPSIEPNPNHNCFPSQSTALYMPVAIGLYFLRRGWGICLGIGVIPLVSLPRMYVGGHYLTDVLASVALAVFAVVAVRGHLEKPVLSKAVVVFDRNGKLRTVAELLIFVWIYQVTVGFREVVWVKRAVETFLSLSG